MSLLLFWKSVPGIPLVSGLVAEEVVLFAVKRLSSHSAILTPLPVGQSITRSLRVVEKIGKKFVQNAVLTRKDEELEL